MLVTLNHVGYFNLYFFTVYSTGIMGSTGNTNIIGSTGITGSMGSTGSTGIVGSTGSTGIMDNTGIMHCKNGCVIFTHV